MTQNNRFIRKLEHLNAALRISDGPKDTWLEDVHLIHQALPGADWDELDARQILWGKTLSFPLIINAITGGPSETEEINRKFASIAAEIGIGMAVGSQTVAMEHTIARKSFYVARKYNPTGLLLANVSANVKPANALKAVEMIEADALQLHLNPSQELFMTEGDRGFKYLEENILKILDSSPVPVIVKEVGFGISKETAHKLSCLGVKWIDISGAGGTNFIRIETERKPKSSNDCFSSWGIPTAAAILEAKSHKLPIRIIASGGIRNGLQLFKTLALGAECGAAAGVFLKQLFVDDGLNKLKRILQQWESDFKKAMLLTGCKNLAEAQCAPYVVTGLLQQWIEQRL